MAGEGDAMVEEPSLVAAGNELDRKPATTESFPQMPERGKAACSEDVKCRAAGDELDRTQATAESFPQMPERGKAACSEDDIDKCRAAGDELDRTQATAESLPQMLEWGKAACSADEIEMITSAFHPGELIEWRAPKKGETPTVFTMEGQFVILSLMHINCGLRLDASDFLVSVLKHYGIQWFDLTPNSITTLSIFAHLCEAYIKVPPTVEVFTDFYILCRNMRGAKTAVGQAYFRLRDKMKKNYPIYFLRASQYMWVSLWFYAKVSQSCRLSFMSRGDSLEEKNNNGKDPLPLSPEQKKQVERIRELSEQGLTGADIVQDYLKHRISPLRRRRHLACEYSGPSDPTRDSDKDLSEEELKEKLSYLLDLKKIGAKQPSDISNVARSLVRAPADDGTNQPLGRVVELAKPLSSVFCAKRKVSARTSGSRKKRKIYSIYSITNKRMPSSGTGSIKGTSSNVVDQTKVVNDSMSNVLLKQPVRYCSLTEVDAAHSKRFIYQEAIEVSGAIPVHNREEMNSDVIWERMQKVQSESVAASSELLEEAKKLVMENRRLNGEQKMLKEGQIMLVQQVKGLEENMMKAEQETNKIREENTKLKDKNEDLEDGRRLLTENMMKAEQETNKIREENKKLKDENEGQKQTIVGLRTEKESMLRSWDNEVNRHKREAAQLINEKEALQACISRANDLVNQVSGTLRHETNHAS